MKKDVKKEDLSSKKINLQHTKKLYQKIINKILDILVFLVDKYKLDTKRLDYAVIKKDHFFIYEDSETRVYFEPYPKAWGIDD